MIEYDFVWGWDGGSLLCFVVMHFSLHIFNTPRLLFCKIIICFILFCYYLFLFSLTVTFSLLFTHSCILMFLSGIFALYLKNSL